MRLLLALFALSAFAADPKPDFSGSWSLVVAKSDFGSSPAPLAMRTRIEHKEPEILVRSTITNAQGAYDSEYRYMTDGRENTNTVRGSEIKSRVTWEGAVLHVAAHAVNGGSQVDFDDEWILSKDKKILTMARTISAPQGRVQQRYVYEKQ
jgi:hypothetical protein